MNTLDILNTPIRLKMRTSEIILCADENGARIMYWGERFESDASYQQLIDATDNVLLTQGLEFAPQISLTTLNANGYMGSPSLQVGNSCNAWGVKFQLKDINYDQSAISFTSEDDFNQLKIRQIIKADYDSNVVSFKTYIQNTHANNTVDILWLASGSIPIEDKYHHRITFEGSWSKEFKEKRQAIEIGLFVKENRRGRTSHDNFPGLYICEEQTTETSGSSYGFHLGWSGNHRFTLESTSENLTSLQMGELLLPDEIKLAPGEEYSSPTMYGTFSDQGLSSVSQNFHTYIRHKLGSREAKVHLNTWEAVYFDHNLETLKQQATIAAKIGVERFVLDDGWFKNRKSDKAGLGDWVVDEEYYPDGLGPLIEHVRDLGLEFGLWLEPEMVNENSDLFRKHPDWILANPPHEAFRSRHQYVLDLSKAEVSDYLFSCIAELLNKYEISYIKWDMNRDLYQPVSTALSPSVHKQTLALYRLLDKIRSAFPNIEIESCASGGGRADFGILAHTNRIWTSDNNDALDRISIQKGCSYFFPPEIMGSHIGPEKCHITGRSLPLETRVATTLSGHTGIECNVAELSDTELEIIKNGFQLFKTIRSFITKSDFIRNTKKGDFTVFQYLSSSRDEALAFCFHHDSSVRSQQKKIYLDGLNKTTNYSINILWPSSVEDVHWIEKNITIEGKVFSGEVLMQVGLQLPRMLPDHILIIQIKSISS